MTEIPHHAGSARAEPVSAPDCDLLYGVRAIAAWCGMTLGACSGRIKDRTLPTFHPPGVKVICARKSSINRALAQYEAAAEAGRSDIVLSVCRADDTENDE